jgi:hypothetical protein
VSEPIAGILVTREDGTVVVRTQYYTDFSALTDSELWGVLHDIASEAGCELKIHSLCSGRERHARQGR